MQWGKFVLFDLFFFLPQLTPRDNIAQKGHDVILYAPQGRKVGKAQIKIFEPWFTLWYI